MNRGRGQLEAIQSMLSSGHASIHLERHTFMLWGLAAGGLILLVPRLFSPEHFPGQSQRMWLQNLFISLVLLATGVLDVVWTSRTRLRRDESLSFVQQQITKLWWLLIALVVVINIGMNLYGGGYFFYGITLVLTGIGIYVHGLFSRQMLSWSGAMQILLGLVMIAVSPDLHVQEWVAASAFGIGFPAFAWMVDHTQERHGLKELLLSLIWLALVLIPAFVAITLFHGQRYEDWQRLSWEAYLDVAGRTQIDPAVVRLPAGIPVAVSVEIDGDLLQPIEQPLTLKMQTRKPVDLAIEHGARLGMIRIEDGEWRSAQDYRIYRSDAKGTLSRNQGAGIDIRFHFQFER